MVRVTATERGELEASGFVVLPGAFDPAPLSAEVDAALADAFPDAATRRSGSAGNAFQYVPMMGRRTPASLALLTALVDAGSRLLGRPALPIRAKGTRYFGGTEWHRDSDLDVPSIGFLAYLEPLDGDTGALRVVAGSHRLPRPPPPLSSGDANALGQPLSTMPGDVIALDEHLLHASGGGVVRRQWRVDVVADPSDSGEVHALHEYLDGIFRPGWDGGYDVARHPSYGPDWQQSGAPWVGRLRELGAYERAQAEEDAVRLRQSP